MAQLLSEDEIASRLEGSQWRREGDEIVRFVHRAQLPINHPRREATRFPGRRKTRGIFAEAWKVNALSQDDTGD